MMKTRIYLERIKTYKEDEIENFLRFVIENEALNLKNGEKVLIKPNLLAPKSPESAIITHPIICEALIKILKDYNLNIYIGDNTPIFSDKITAKKTGYSRLIKKYGIKWYFFKNFKEFYRDREQKYSLEFPEDFFEFKHIFNVAKMKTHTMMLTTLCVKNLFGCLPTNLRFKLHFRADMDKFFFAEILLKIYEILKPTLNILDGIVIMEGEGPSSGKPKEYGLIGASKDAITFDYIINSLFAFKYENPQDKVAVKKGLVNKNIEYPLKDPSDFPQGNIKPPEGFEKNSLAFDRHSFFRYIYKVLFLNRPTINKNNCKKCGICVKSCPVNAITKNLKFNYFKCIRCYCCQELCPHKAIYIRKPFIPFFR